MERLPDAELELMMIIWEAKSPITRIEIEEKLPKDREVLPNTILTLLTRLEKRGFIKKEKDGKVNYYSPLVPKEPYVQEEGAGFLKKMFRGSLKNFAAALYDGEELQEEDVEELMEFLSDKMKERR